MQLAEGDVKWCCKGHAGGLYGGFWHLISSLITDLNFFPGNTVRLNSARGAAFLRWDKLIDVVLKSHLAQQKKKIFFYRPVCYSVEGKKSFTPELEYEVYIPWKLSHETVH